MILEHQTGTICYWNEPVIAKVIIIDQYETSNKQIHNVSTE